MHAATQGVRVSTRLQCSGWLENGATSTAITDQRHVREHPYLRHGWPMLVRAGGGTWAAQGRAAKAARMAGQNPAAGTADPKAAAAKAGPEVARLRWRTALLPTLAGRPLRAARLQISLRFLKSNHFCFGRPKRG